MPNFTDYEITTRVEVVVVAKESGLEVSHETFMVSAAGSATTSGKPLRPAIAGVVSRAAEKVVAHANAVQHNENVRRGVA